MQTADQHGLDVRWRGPLPQSDMAVKQIACTNGHHVESVKAELEVLYAAARWSHCVVGKGAFWAPGMGEDGVTRGTTYYLCMQCVPLPAMQPGCRACSDSSPVSAADVQIVTSCTLGHSTESALEV